MKKVRFLVLLLFCSVCFADEVILKNGKVLTGKIISETEELIVLKDADGVELRIKKSQIESMKISSEKPAVSELPQAEEKKKARVYKQEDLENMPEVSVFGKEQSDIEPEPEFEEEQEVYSEEEDEAYWKGETLRIYARLERARNGYEGHKAICDKVIPDALDFPYGIPTPLAAEQFEERRRLSCVAADRHKRDLDKAQQEYDEFLEEARKKGIPPGWVDPERIAQ